MRVNRRVSAIVAAGCMMTLVSCGPIVIPKTLTEEEKIEAQAAAARRADVESVASMLIGSFTSEAQAAESKDHIDVRIESVRLWEDRQDGIWIYFEQAAASALTKPYRQRIYRLFVQPNGIVVVEVYELPGEPLRFAGAWRRMDLLEDLSPKSLILKDGCQLALQKVSDIEWRGGTVGTNCQTTLRGASYAVSESTITPEGLRVWDRGYDSAGKQVWGPEKTGYEFVRVR